MCVPMGNVFSQPYKDRAWHFHKKIKNNIFRERNIAFLENYFCNICEKPSLEEIENVAGVMEVKRESIY